MTNRETLRSLADACEALSGPCRETDGWIYAHMTRGEPYIIGNKPGRFPREPIYGERLDVMEALASADAADYINAPPYTASIDSAMSLAGPSWWLNINGPLTEAAYGYSREDLRVMSVGFQMIGAPYSAAARTAITGDVIGQIARALIAASLRAIGEGL